jgi:hypothetical protein
MDLFQSPLCGRAQLLLGVGDRGRRLLLLLWLGDCGSLRVLDLAPERFLSSRIDEFFKLRLPTLFGSLLLSGLLSQTLMKTRGV